MIQAKVPQDPKDWQVKSSPEFKLKDKLNRSFMVIHLKDFGFVPETIIIQKSMGQNNKMRVFAVLTEEEVKKSDKKKKEMELKAKKTLEVVKKQKEEIENGKSQPGDIKKAD